jgi:hypothetical protein
MKDVSVNDIPVSVNHVTRIGKREREGKKKEIRKNKECR